MASLAEGVSTGLRSFLSIFREQSEEEWQDERATIVLLEAAHKVQNYLRSAECRLFNVCETKATLQWSDDELLDLMRAAKKDYCRCMNAISWLDKCGRHFETLADLIRAVAQVQTQIAEIRDEIKRHIGGSSLLKSVSDERVVNYTCTILAEESIYSVSLQCTLDILDHLVGSGQICCDMWDLHEAVQRRIGWWQSGAYQSRMETKAAIVDPAEQLHEAGPLLYAE